MKIITEREILVHRDRVAEAIKKHRNLKMKTFKTLQFIFGKFNK
jgi:hypothetical protein